MMRSIITLPSAALLAVVACSGDERPPAEPAPAEPAPAPAQPAPPPPVAADVEPTADEVPVREDFEAEAEAMITLATYRAELDRLEKELDSR
jgi:hypothetical protein